MVEALKLEADEVRWEGEMPDLRGPSAAGVGAEVVMG